MPINISKKFFRFYHDLQTEPDLTLKSHNFLMWMLFIPFFFIRFIASTLSPCAEGLTIDFKTRHFSKENFLRENIKVLLFLYTQRFFFLASQGKNVKSLKM